VPGEFVVVGQGLRLLLESRGDAGRWIVRPVCEDAQGQLATTESLLKRHGQLPLPPYIREGKASAADCSSYQTVYAQIPGSVAAPTAGLHFSDALFAELAFRGIDWVDLTLHIGVGTFRPIETDDLSEHVMHAEWAELSDQVAEKLIHRRATGGRVVAVGTTTARTLESAAATGIIEAFSGYTTLFIQPGHCFGGLDALITNFHLPRSSLLVLVSAFGGIDLIRKAYQEAIRRRYRFFSYGDAMLIV
jgi:S-adenosylmethionine:tRNA ribosyltransferase-isomerase